MSEWNKKMRVLGLEKRSNLGTLVCKSGFCFSTSPPFTFHETKICDWLQTAPSFLYISFAPIFCQSPSAPLLSPLSPSPPLQLHFLHSLFFLQRHLRPPRPPHLSSFPPPLPPVVLVSIWWLCPSPWPYPASRSIGVERGQASPFQWFPLSLWIRLHVHVQMHACW